MTRASYRKLCAGETPKIAEYLPMIAAACRRHHAADALSQSGPAGLSRVQIENTT